MAVLYLLVPLAVLMGLGFTLAFIWSVQKGQLEDLETPRHRILIPDLDQEVSAKNLESGLKS